MFRATLVALAVIAASLFAPGCVVVDNGVEGDEARFTVEVLLQGEALARGVGRSKRVAERRAAETALEARTESAE